MTISSTAAPVATHMEKSNLSLLDVKNWQTQYAQSNAVESRRLMRAWKGMAKKSREEILSKCRGLYYAN